MIPALLVALFAAHQVATWKLATDETHLTVSVVRDRIEVSDLGCAGDSHTWTARSEMPLIQHVWVGEREVPLDWHFDRGTLSLGGTRLTLVFQAAVIGPAGTCLDNRPSSLRPPHPVAPLALVSPLLRAWLHAPGSPTTAPVPGRDAQATVELRSIWRARKGRGPVEHWIEISNRSAESITIPVQDSLDLNNLDPGGPADVWWIRRGASNALTEGGTFQEPVKAGLHLDLVSDHHNPSSPVPWMAVQTSQNRGLYVGWEFSGLGHVEAKGGTKGGTGVPPVCTMAVPAMEGGIAAPVSLSLGLMPDFKTDIRPGETLTIPAAFVGCYKGDIDEGSQSLHRFVLEKLRANPPKSFPDPTTICGIYLDAGGDKATTQTLLQSVAFAKNLGLDTFLVDAMWFPACGDWRWDPARFPQGSKPIEDGIRAGGMKFALWCAWDNGGVSSDPGALSVRGPVGHADWFETKLPANWQPGPFYGVSACMASDEARAWAIKKTQSLVGDMHLDFLKTDVHPMINRCVQTNHRHTHGTDVGYWSCLGVYEVWDKLRRAYPNVVLENCSGASHIKDFGVVQRCAYTAVTDTLSNLPDRAGIYDSTFVLPPSALMTYTYERGYGLPGDDPGSYLFRSGMMSAWDLAPTDSKDWTAEEKSAGRAALRSFKEWIRPVLQDCKVHHVLPRPDGKRWDGMFFWSDKLGKGTLFVFRPDSDVERQAVRLAGLESRERYLVWSEDGSVTPVIETGTELMTQGVALRLRARYTSDLVYLQRADLPKPKSWGVPAPFSPSVAKVENDYFGSTTTLSWSPSLGVRCYRVTVSANPDLSNPLVEKIVYEPNLALTGAVNDHATNLQRPTSLSSLSAAKSNLFWRVQAIAWGGSRSSAVGRFQPLQPKHWQGSFISDLQWVKAEAGSDRVHRDETYAGKRLSVAGKAYPKGVWTHSFNDGRPADLVLDIAGKGYGIFASDVGVDDAAGGGSVQFQVILDGQLAAETEILKPGQVRRLRVSVTNAKALTLRVLNGGDGYNSDHAVWGLARLIIAGGADPFAR